MTNPKNGLARLGLDNAIRLRWALRDIHARRLHLCPLSPADLRILVEMGCVEIAQGELILTPIGMDQKEIGD